VGGEVNRQRLLYVALKDDKTTNKPLLRQLKSNEKLLEIHTMLKCKKVVHIFYALAPSYLTNGVANATQTSKKLKSGSLGIELI
jgi:hypothetical protein